jgi:hypothetical protein
MLIKCNLHVYTSIVLLLIKASKFHTQAILFFSRDARILQVAITYKGYGLLSCLWVFIVRNYYGILLTL